MLLIEQSGMGQRCTAVKTQWKNVLTKSVRTTWKPHCGRSEVWCLMNIMKLLIDLNIYRIKARAGNGIAFGMTGKTEKELTQFNFAGNDFTAWYYKVEDRPLGPEKLMDADGIRLRSHEYPGQ